MYPLPASIAVIISLEVVMGEVLPGVRRGPRLDCLCFIDVRIGVVTVAKVDDYPPEHFAVSAGGAMLTFAESIRMSGQSASLTPKVSASAGVIGVRV
jgi:hypothetical protein